MRCLSTPRPRRAARGRSPSFHFRYGNDVFDASLLEAAAREKEIELTTFGRHSGRPSRRIVWITALDGRLYVRFGLGLTRDWPKNLLATGRGILHIGGQDVP